MIKEIKKIIKLYFDGLVLSSIFLLVFLSLTSIMLKLNHVSSIFFALQHILIILWSSVNVVRVVRELKKNKKRFNLILMILTLSIVFLSFLSVFVDLLINNANIFQDFDYFSKLFIFCSLFLFVFSIHVSNNVKIAFVILKILTYIFSVLTILLFLIGTTRTWSGFVEWKLLTLNFSNPNIAGMFLSVMVILTFYCIYTSKSIFSKILSIGLCVCLFVLLYLTSCRTALLAVLGFLGFGLLYKYLFKDYAYTFVHFVVLFPLIFLSVYFLYFVISSNGYHLSSGTSIGGKGSDSRYVVWFDALNLVNFNPFLGNYFLASHGTGNFQLHNTLIDVLVGYGFVVLILASIFFIFIIFNRINDTKTLNSKSLIIATICFVFCLGTFESFPFYASNGLSLIPLSFLSFDESLLFKTPFEHNKKFKYQTCDVLLINNVFGFGSTGKIVEDCHNYYLANGIQSYVVYGRNKHFVSDYRVCCIESLLEVRLSQILNNFLHTNSFGYLYMTFKLINIIRVLKPKVIHIHALNDAFVNYSVLLKYLAKNKIKVVYTFHSEHMLVGNCGGYSFGCNKYVSNCLGCDLKKHNHWNKTMAFLCKKHKSSLFAKFLPNNLCFTAVSPWLTKQLLADKTIEKYHVETIMNGTRLCDFRINDNFDRSKKQVLFVTASFNNTNKGFDYFVKLASKYEGDSSIKFVAVGLDKYEKVTPSNLYIVNNADTNLLFNLYSSSNLLVLCSKAETFSMPVCESLVCGTPVVGFCAGGPESIAINKYSKFVKYGDINSLINVVNDFLSKSFEKTNIVSESRKKYSVYSMASQYIKIYSKLTDNDIRESCFIHDEVTI